MSVESEDTMTMFRVRRDSPRTPGSVSVRRNLVVASLVLALLAGCTAIAGNPTADTGSADGPGESAVGGPGDGADAAPSSSELIAASLASGEIDEPTSWLYRTWATFGDPQLPEQLTGAPEGHDTGVLASLPMQLDDLPDDIRAQVEPYLLRPTDPRSIYAAGSDAGTDDPPGLRGSGDALAVRPAATGKWGRCVEGWDTQVVPGVPFRVWAYEDLNFAGEGSDTAAQDAMAATAAALQTHAPLMIADMGDVIRDLPDSDPDPRSDDRIDVYVLRPGSHAVDRDGEFSETPAGGRTTSTPPYDDTAGSAFVLISAELISEPDRFAWTVVHELFHVLQYTHHARLGARWIYDATAEWAASYYLRGTSSYLLHEERAPIKLNEWAVSLESETDLHAYGAYVWPLFMEQQVGPEAIFKLWKALAAVSRGAGGTTLIEVMDQQLPVAANYPEFAMRMLNGKRLRGDPIKPRFVDLDATFPDRLPKMIDHTLGDEPLPLSFENMHGLSYRPYRIGVPPSSGGQLGDEVLVKFSGTATSYTGVAPTLEGVILDENGTYHRQRILYTGDGDTVCVAEGMYLVLANTSTRQLHYANGTITLERKYDEAGQPQPCARVEASHPEWPHQLSDGETVEIDGTENDGKPDATALAVTVRDVDPDMVGEYVVEVTVSGGTLHSARTFRWPLAEFDDLGKRQRRKIEPLPLDADLTDSNRPLTIDARLTRAGKDVGQHAPTVELHGPGMCDVRDRSQKCELVGDLKLTATGIYDNGPEFHRRIKATFNVDATLSVRLGMPDTSFSELSGISFDHEYFNAGSTWTLAGSSSYEVCAAPQHDEGEYCSGPSAQTFTHADKRSPTFEGEEDYFVNMKQFVNETPSENLEIYANISIISSNTPPLNTGGNVIDPTTYEVWPIGCPEPPEKSRSGPKFWADFSTTYDGKQTAFRPPWWSSTRTAWSDVGLDSQEIGTEINVDCSAHWTEKDYGLTKVGGTASVNVSFKGTLSWVRAGQ